MADLSTQYLGMTLKNPVIAGSSGLTNSVKSIKQLEEGGAGAVIGDIDCDHHGYPQGDADHGQPGLPWMPSKVAQARAQ